MKPIPNFPGYQVTTDGRVWSEPKPGKHKKGKWLKPVMLNRGYLRVTLCNGRQYNCFIHRLVLETYIGPCPKGMECRHLDGNPANNNLNNLKWGTRSENSYDAVRHGVHPGLKRKGEKHPSAKLTEDQVRLIYASYHNGLHTQKELADYFGISTQNICGICNGRNWKHLWSEAV
jgi:hypothetical protein